MKLHSLFRIDDGQDALLKLHSQAVARPDFRKLLDTSPRAQAAVARLNEVYAFECGQHSAALQNGTRTFITEADCRQSKPKTGAKGAGRAKLLTDLLNGDVGLSERQYSRLLDMRGGCMCPSGHPPCSACCDPLTEDEAQELIEQEAPAVAEAPEQWHAEAPQTAQMRFKVGDRLQYFDGSTSIATVHSVCIDSSGVGYYLLSYGNGPVGYSRWSDYELNHETSKPQADTRPLLQWVKGCDVPEGERIGLWFIRGTNCVLTACKAINCCWLACNKYLRAAPGVREGDAFDANLYRSE